MIINGKELRELKLKELKTHPGLAVIQVGDDEASKIYIREKEKLAHNLGYIFKHIKFNSNISEEELINAINILNNDHEINGIIVQMPLPKHIDETKIQNTILPEKDVDGLTHINNGKLLNNSYSLIPCTPKGIIDLLDYYKIQIEGKNTLVIGRSVLVGKPIAVLLLNRNATVTVCHNKTENIEYYTKNADIIIVAVGKKHFLKSDMIKTGAIIIDVGINRIDGKIYGDADYENLKEKCSYITPVPGGVGPMTVYELMEQVYNSHTLKKQNK